MIDQKPRPNYSILFAISFAHLLNDLIQAVIPACYPIIKDSFHLSFTEIGLITFSFQLSASFFQPFIGYYTDKYPQPFSQIFGMLFSSLGIIFLAYASHYYMIIIGVILIGTGSSIFHPESARVSYMASGGRRGLAQSIFQVGGNFGTAMVSLLVAAFVVPNSIRYVLLFLIASTLGLGIITNIAFWYKNQLKNQTKSILQPIKLHNLSKKKVNISIAILLVIIFSKFFYAASISTYYTFYLIEKFNITKQSAQVHLFIYLIAYAIGTISGGPLGDKFGRKYVIWFSVFGATPFALMLPYANLFYTDILMVIIALIMSSAFPAILVYAQELLPKKLGMVSGLFYGFGFGMGAMGAALLGVLTDYTDIYFVYKVCSFLPIIGAICYFLPNIKKRV